MTITMILQKSCTTTSRGPKIARVGEEVVHDAHDGLWGPKTPPLGVRPGSLAEPGPQRSDRSLRRSSGQILSWVPSLADAPAEAIDGASSSRRPWSGRKKVVAKQREEKRVAKMKLLNDKVRHDMPLTEAEWAAWW